MDKQLLSILVCPSCKGTLKYDKNAAELLCTFDGLAFAIIDGVPNMLESDARRMSEEEKLDRAKHSSVNGVTEDQKNSL